ncbi:MAG: GNAT family N-acetyltransferase [Planctomycetota bacterium]|nr:GNAT family N-acetyltransferase [Planctomycetota bacterium]
MNPDIAFRAIEDSDLEFLYQVYADSRAEELSIVPWSDEQKEEFLRMQFRAQHEFYQQNYRQAEFEIVLVDGEPAGRLYVERREDEHRIMDIALLASQRGRGIGGKIIRDLLQEAAAVGKPVTIHVLKQNRALNLYDRLGFREIGSTEVYSLMEWTPDSLPTEPSVE